MKSGDQVTVNRPIYEFGSADASLGGTRRSDLVFVPGEPLWIVSVGSKPHLVVRNAQDRTDNEDITKRSFRVRDLSGSRDEWVKHEYLTLLVEAD